MSSHIGAGLICSFAPKTPHYYAHFRSKNFVGKKNSHIQGKSAVYPVGLTSILTQDVGIFLRQNRVRMCALWLSNSCTNPAREKNDNPSVTAASCHLPLHKGGRTEQCLLFFLMWENIKSVFVWFRCPHKKYKNRFLFDLGFGVKN